LEAVEEAAEEVSSACRRAMRLSGDRGLLGRVGTLVLRMAPVLKQASSTCTTSMHFYEDTLSHDMRLLANWFEVTLSDDMTLSTH